MTDDNGWTVRTLKELIEVRLRENNAYRDSLREADHVALALQAKEYERRLTDLNHAHAEAARTLATYVPREVYERYVELRLEWKIQIEKHLVTVDERIKSVELGLVNLPGGVKSLELGLATQAGQFSGSRMTMTTAITLGALAFAALGGLIAVLGYMK